MITFEVKLKQFYVNLKRPLSHNMTHHKNSHLPKMLWKNLIHPFIFPFTTIMRILTQEDIAGL